jgi:hypothetical protein
MPLIPARAKETLCEIVSNTEQLHVFAAINECLDTLESNVSDTAAHIMCLAVKRPSFGEAALKNKQYGVTSIINSGGERTQQKLQQHHQFQFTFRNIVLQVCLCFIL